LPLGGLDLFTFLVMSSFERKRERLRLVEPHLFDTLWCRVLMLLGYDTPLEPFQKSNQVVTGPLAPRLHFVTQEDASRAFGLKLSSWFWLVRALLEVNQGSKRNELAAEALA
jgi:hypothetical protein